MTTRGGVLHEAQMTPATDTPDTALLQLANSDHYRRFICAILLQAMIDAKKGEAEAREWIHSDYAKELADRVDMGEHFPPRDEHLANNGGLARNYTGARERETNDLYGTQQAIAGAWRKTWASRCQ